MCKSDILLLSLSHLSLSSLGIEDHTLLYAILQIFLELTSRLLRMQGDSSNAKATHTKSSFNKGVQNISYLSKAYSFIWRSLDMMVSVNCQQHQYLVITFCAFFLDSDKILKCAGNGEEVSGVITDEL